MSRNKLIRVTFEPGGTPIDVPAGTLISKAAAAAGMAIETPCGGMGSCGKCRIIVSGDAGGLDSSEARLLTPSEIESGVRLACRSAVTGEMTVTIPESSLSKVQKILSQGALRDCCVASDVSKIACQLAAPSLEDERPEFERLAGSVEARDISLRPNLRVARSISTAMRQANYAVTAVAYGDELIAIESGDTTDKCYGIAFDLGSTTVVGYLMDLVTGSELAVSAVMNPQTMYGSDLVSRISFATTQENGGGILQSAAVDALNRIARHLAKVAHISLQHVYKVTVVGNTCITHLLLGIDVSSLGQSPYVPSLASDIVTTARELSLETCPEAKVLVLPNVAGFVGSDLVGVLLSSHSGKEVSDPGRKTYADERDIHISDISGQPPLAARLAVDIGTNGEMALIYGGRTLVCSAAAGPAFEGAGISSGMRGSPGAIDSVVIGDRVEFSTIDHRRPIGICGSGLVDAIAGMLDAGIVDESGRMLSPDEVEGLPPDVSSRLVNIDGGVEFVLATQEMSASGRAITLTAADIRHLQLAKGSMHAAMQTLIKLAGTSDDRLDEILLAGAFGNYIRVESAIRIGLIPPVAKEKVTSIGNAAGAGARLALLCGKEMDTARRLAREAEHVELGGVASLSDGTNGADDVSWPVGRGLVLNFPAAVAKKGGFSWRISVITLDWA